jgi:hypothetical protein
LSDIERILLTNPDDPKIKELTTRMSRFVCSLENEQDRETEIAYIVETKIPLVFHRYTPDKVESQKNVYLITKLEKNGSKVFLTPGVMALIMFMKIGYPADGSTAKNAQLFFMDYFIKQIKGAYIDGNDVLIGGKKIMGLTVLLNGTTRTAMIRFMLTAKSKCVKYVTSDKDFEDRKYSGITGVCDETGMSEESVQEMIYGFIKIARAWRPGDAAK